MFKKLLFIIILFVSVSAFSQKTLEKLSAVPNPFSTETSIKFTSTTSQTIFLSVKNVLGRTVYKKEYKVKAGNNSIVFYKNDLRSGMYIYTIQNVSELISKRFVIR